MKKKSIFVSFLFLLLAIGCKDDNVIEQTPVATGPPVETRPANTTYSPAFQGQTRANGAETTTPIATSVITSSLVAPWGITALPDGRLMITEKGGNLRIVTVEGTIGEPIQGLPQVNAEGQGGLLGICLDPAFDSNKMVYWVFSEAVDGGNITAVAKGKLLINEQAIESPQVIYRAYPAHASTLHYGGRIVFDTNGNLWVSIGERSVLETRPLAQALNSGLGKVVRITTSGQPAAGNIAFDGSAALPELYSIGHRNPQGLAIHPETGELWLSEHGPRGGDEINRVLSGKDYGWPTITYGIEYNGEPIGDAIQQMTGMEQPVYYWDPVVSPSGITFYKGNRVTEWKNNLFVTSLTQKHIIRLIISDNRVVGEERMLAGENQRFRDITQDNEGILYAVTDEGRLYKIDKQQ